MKKRLLLLSFLEGAAVMAAELCGAKLLAPVFGSSLFVWASVMGVTLAALALGYFYGGWITERSQDRRKTLSRILNAASLCVLLMPLISYYLIPRISYLPFLPGVLCSTTLLLFFPVFLLGASSPLFILIQTTNQDEAGKVSGTVYAVSTAGGILATFLCGFFLIPAIGLNASLFIFGGVLFVFNLLVFNFFKPGTLFLVLALAYLNLQFSLRKNNALMSSDSILGHLEVKDIVSTGKESYRILTVNDIVQTEMSLKDKHSVSAYVNLLDSLIPITATVKPALVLGLGGGLTANLLQKKGYATDGVEFDERIIEAARNYFYLDTAVRSYDEDARYFLNTSKKKYAVVLVDVFKAEEQPSHVITLESLNQLKENLTEDALLFINWHGYTSGQNGMGTRILYNTLQKSGFTIKLCSVSSNENYRNVIFVASLNQLKELPFELHEPLASTRLVNTDNRPLLEKYNARVNKTWRLNYLRYYQNNK